MRFERGEHGPLHDRWECGWPYRTVEPAPSCRGGALDNVPATVDSIYEQIGGTAAVSATVEELHARVLGDARLAPYFAGIDVDRQRHHMRAFVAAALGGTHTYRGHDMAAAHTGLGITGRDFDRVAGHLAGALRTLGVPTGQVQAILARIAPLRDDIVGGDPAPMI